MSRGGDPITNGLITDVLHQHRTNAAEEPEVVVCKSVDIVIDELLDLIRALHDPTPGCRLDHHGYCQTHCWLETSTCPHRRAQQLLAQQETNTA